MCRISESFVVKTRRNLVATVFAGFAAAGVLLSGTAAWAEAVGSPVLIIDIGCAQSDLKLFSMIERNGNNGLSTTATLLETSDLLLTARNACNVGDVDNALALYDTAIRRLENPSDIARR
jgi:hypothetical protein